MNNYKYYTIKVILNISYIFFYKLKMNNKTLKK